MNERTKDAARAHLAACVALVEAKVTYDQALAASLGAAELVGLAHERRVQAQATVEQAFLELTAALRA